MVAGKPVILLKEVKAKPRPEYLVVAPLYVEAFDDGIRQFTLSTRADLTPRTDTQAGTVLREIQKSVRRNDGTNSIASSVFSS